VITVMVLMILMPMGVDVVDSGRLIARDGAGEYDLEGHFFQINEVFSSGAAFFKLDADAKASWMQQNFISRYVTSDSERWQYVLHIVNCNLMDIA